MGGEFLMSGEKRKQLTIILGKKKPRNNTWLKQLFCRGIKKSKNFLTMCSCIL
jgi:hypothetical protein